MLLDIGSKVGVVEQFSKSLASNSALHIAGRVNEVGVPLPCRVRLLDKSSGLIVYDKLTDKQGFYRFESLLNKRYFLVAHHPTSQFNAVIQDNVVPK